MSGSAAEAQALALYRAGRLAEARDAWRAILARAPDDPQALHMLGYILARMGERDEGMALIDRSIERAPRAAPFLNNRAQLLAEAGRNEEAIRDLRRAVQADPRFAPGFAHLGILLRREGRLDESLAALRRALALDGNHPVARENLGIVLNEVGLARKEGGDLEGAAAAFSGAIAAGAASPAHFLNAASVALDLGRIDEAEGLYARALQAQPGWADAEYGLAQVLLRRGRFAEGWRGYERRFETQPPQSEPRRLPMPRLAAGELDGGHRVAVWSEQGAGDQLLFSTLLPELARRGVRAVVEVDERLAAMYRRSLPALDFTTRASSAKDFSACDRELPLGSLAALFRPTRESFAAQPHALLQPDVERVARCRSRLGPGRWIAVSWRSLQGGGRKGVAQRKSMPVEALASLAGAGVRLLDVQYGDVDDDRAAFERAHPGLMTRIDGLDAYADLEGVAAALAACEAVVTTSNVTAHLAGAIGRRTFLAYPEARSPFFYWIAGDAGRSPWYPSVEIVTGPKTKRWEELMEAVVERLAR